MVGNRVGAVGFQLPDRPLTDPILPDGQLSGNGHHAHEIHTGNLLLGTFPGLHPADHNPAAVLSQQGLGGVEVNAVFNGMGSFLVEVLVGIQIADVVHFAVSVVIFQGLCPHFHNAVKQNSFAVQVEKVGAFPHIPVAVAAGIQGACQLPVQAVPAFVEQNISTAIPAPVHRDTVDCAVLYPDFGIPEIPGVVPLGDQLGGNHRVVFVFFVVHTISQGNALGLEFSLRGDLHTGVKQQMPSIGQLHPAAGEAAIAVIPGIRGQGRRQVLPADKVLGFGVTPVHGSPLGIVGIVLKKQMVLPLVGGKAVGIVHPAHTGGQVERRQLGHHLRAALGLIVPGFLQYFGHRSFSPVAI